MYVIPAPLPDKDPAATAPVTLRLVRVPRLVMFGWAEPETTVATGIVPITFAALILEIPEPFDAIKRPFIVRPVIVPTLVMLGWAGFVTLSATLRTPTVFANCIFEIPEPSPYNHMALRTPV